ncbi:hypothetical protein MAHJHV30_48360 [Mycobacterium avium subsp. hominissuis]|uniref:hypothetical protein n=1 Tax=Mycobacterium avium TaxID=1764 RepID=UPI0009FFCFB7|nr:hypothetical protein [Mycobacterium avium]MBZ4612384.1 hypothetical protein [Mycobacterium avium subsp. hominissuis]
MPHITTTVYLNDGEHQFLGFNTHAPARLYQAVQFDLEIIDYAPADTVVPGALEIVFEQLNIARPQHPWVLRYRLAGHRSLSVGDVVVLGETAWACNSVGWTPISADELRAALTAAR